VCDASDPAATATHLTTSAETVQELLSLADDVSYDDVDDAGLLDRLTITDGHCT